MLCFSYVNIVFQSIFDTKSFLCRLMQKLFTKNVMDLILLNIVMCAMLLKYRIGVVCVADKSKVD